MIDAMNLPRARRPLDIRALPHDCGRSISADWLPLSFRIVGI